MRFLVVNSGSTSVKAIAEKRGGDQAKHTFAPDDPNPVGSLREWLGGTRVDAVAHRVVHGGQLFSSAVRIDEHTLRAIENLAELAPIHNPIALRWIRAAQTVLPDVPHVAVFDTSFYHQLPEKAWRYAIPVELADRYRLRRYGFHGLAHQGMLERWKALRPELPDGGRLISLQLGGGSSITAVDRGHPIDTSMGFSPLSGLVMATRSGDVDAGALFHLARYSHLGVDAIENLLNHKSGLLGLSGISGDMARLLEDGSAGAERAIDLYCYRARKYVGAYLASLGGADGILFGGGIGEHAGAIRARILDNLSPLGIRLNLQANAQLHEEGRISHPDSPIAVWVIAVDEASVMINQARALL